MASEEVSERPDPDVNREVRCARRDVTRQMKDVRWAGVGGGAVSEGMGVCVGRDTSVPLGLELERKQTRGRS